MASKLQRPFVHPSLLKDTEKTKPSKSRPKKTSKKSPTQSLTKGIEIQARSTTILPNFVSKVFNIHNGQKFISLKVTEKMVGQKFGEFARTRIRGKDPRPKAATRR